MKSGLAALIIKEIRSRVAAPVPTQTIIRSSESFEADCVRVLSCLVNRPGRNAAGAATVQCRRARDSESCAIGAHIHLSAQVADGGLLNRR